MDTQDIIHKATKLLVPTYGRPPVLFTHGEGVHLYDREGRRYIDFGAGIAVTSLGHGNPAWLEAVRDQAGKLTHVSNLYHTAPQVDLAERLVRSSFADRVFFSNSGAEAVETALKFARKWAHRNHGGHKTRFVAFQRGFHGRTFGALSVTHKPAYRTAFGPLVPDVAFAPYNDLDAASQVIDHDTCAVIVEPVQGEGGIHPATPEFLRGLRALCDEHQALLIFDEVQCGLGRTGFLWAHEAYEVTPDIMTLAKPLANGLPIGATLATEGAAAAIGPGDHGSTFAAGPLICRAAQVVFDQIKDPELLEEVRAKGEELLGALNSLPCDSIVEVRGRGLMIGVELDIPVKPLIAAALECGLLIIPAGDRTVRICPPLVIGRDEIHQGLAILGECIQASPGKA